MVSRVALGGVEKNASRRSSNVAAVVDAPVRSEGARLTARGAATRERIVQAAAELMAAKGVAATTLDEVRLASGTSKSQHTAPVTAPASAPSTKTAVTPRRHPGRRGRSPIGAVVLFCIDSISPFRLR